jgi:hypothetical protein
VRPTGLAPIAIGPLLNDVRARVGRVEIADLPRESTDPMVIAQIARFARLPLEIEFARSDDEGRRITAGKRGILEFFAYELLKNALRNCSGKAPLRALVAKQDGRVRITLVNDLEVREERAEDGTPRWRLPRIAGMKPVLRCGVARRGRHDPRTVLRTRPRRRDGARTVPDPLLRARVLPR